MEELQKVDTWIPLTPDKCLPAVPKFNSNADLNKFVLINSPDNSQKKDVESSIVIEGRRKFLSGNLDFDSRSASVAPSTPIQKGNPKKKRSGSFDLNDTPQKKPRTKKHKPRIFDESKPKKTPKAKIKPLIPGNSKASARVKRKVRKDSYKASDPEDADVLAHSTTSGTIPESLVLKVSSPQQDILDHDIASSSPPEFEQNIHMDRGHDVKSCRRALNFNLENESDVFSGGGAEMTRDLVAYCFNEFLSNPQDAVNEQIVDTNTCAAKVHKHSLDPILVVMEKDESSHVTQATLLKANVHDSLLCLHNISNTGLGDNLEAESISQPNQGYDEANIQRYDFLKVYERRTKGKIGNEAGTTDQTGCQDRFQRVYKRRARKNIGTVSLAGHEADIYQNDLEAQIQNCFQQMFQANACLMNSRKLSPNFPIICKKRRIERIKTFKWRNSLDIHPADKGLNTLNTPRRCKVAFTKKRRYRRRGAKRGTKKHLKIAKRDKNGRFAISRRGTSRSSRISNGAKMICLSTSTLGQNGKSKSHFVLEILPTEYQIRSAMDDPDSYQCVFELCPMAKCRKKRSFHHKRTKSACREENTDLEALSSDLTLSPLVVSERKRSEGCKGSTVILGSLCPNSEEINGVNELGSSIDKLACNEVQECTQYEDLHLRTNISVCDEHRDCQPYEGLWPRKNKLVCNEIQGCQQPEHLCTRTDKSTEIQECSKALFPRTEGLTQVESLVASLIPKLENIKISDARAHKRMLAISKKKTTNNTDQPVLWNPFDPITLKRMLAVSKKKTTSSAGQLVLWNHLSLIVSHKGKHKPSSGSIVSYKGKDKPLRAKLPKVDIDMESLRVWNLLIENDGEIDEELDKDKEIWWEEQRKIFQGRAASFIARMRLVLGDRRFSQWKGSVVDSVVGVFLTQNVSDHLSSNAFMLLASAFPPQNKQEMTTSQGQDSVTREGIPDSFEREVSANQKDTIRSCSSQSPMSTCRSSTDELSFDRNTSECLSTSYSHLPHVGDCINEIWHGTLEEKDLGAEVIFGSQATVTSCSSEVITSAIGTREEKYLGAEDIYGSQATVTSCSSEVRNSAIGTRDEKDLGAEDICGSQATVTSCSSEVITSDKSGDLGNEVVNLPEMISRKKDEFPKKENVWDELRKTYSTGKYSGLTEKSRDSVNWEAVRNADIEKIVEPIKCRGQSNVLGAKIKKFLNRLVEDHGSIDLEWLRDVPQDKAKEYLLSIHGIGPKSVDCVRLLTLRHLAFPVDINVARIAVRLGWVPLQPLPDGIQMHLLERYPMESAIQKYLWPRLCKLDLLTLYELHYLMITFGKVFCTKKSPNCNACPMRAECRHFASAFASARLCLPGPQQKGAANFKQSVRVDEVPNKCTPSPALSLSSRSFLESRFHTQDCEPIIEMPASPEQKPLELLERDIEDFPYEEVEHEQEIPTIQLNTEEFRENVMSFIKKSNTREFQENVLNFIDEINTLHRDEEVSKALVLLNPKYASVPARKLKVESRLRTEHLVYELPDSHPLLSEFEQREPDDLSPYLLSICRTEQTAAEICPGSTSYDQNNQIVYGTIMIPCRTANRGSFPLNGTYFQSNEVFADQESSENPIPVPRSSIWNLRQKVLYCGTSVKTIANGLTTRDIQYCFWRGFICIRGYDRKKRAPRPLHDRFYSGSKSVN